MQADSLAWNAKLAPRLAFLEDIIGDVLEVRGFEKAPASGEEEDFDGFVSLQIDCSEILMPRPLFLVHLLPEVVAQQVEEAEEQEGTGEDCVIESSR